MLTEVISILNFRCQVCALFPGLPIGHRPVRIQARKKPSAEDPKATEGAFGNLAILAIRL